MLSPTSVQADNGAGLTRGIIGLMNRGQPRKPDDWGSLRAWAWGASRVLDYLATEPKVDSKRVGIEELSPVRQSRAVTMAFDERFAIALAASSGERGAKLHRRNFGEAVENLTGSGEYHWMAGNFLKYGAAEVDSGARTRVTCPWMRTADRLVRSAAYIHQLRRSGTRGRQLARPAGQLHGDCGRTTGVSSVRGDAGSLGRLPDRKDACGQHGLLAGELAWRQHDGGHTSGPNLPQFLEWANKKFPEAK